LRIGTVILEANPSQESKSSLGSILAVALASARPLWIGAGERRGKVFWTIFVILLVLWLLGFFAFHITSGFIHLVLVVAVVVLILGLVRRGA
jgi:hypothetical protein